MISQKKHEIKHEWIGGKLNVAITHIDEYEPEDVIGVYLSSINTISNMLNQLLQNLSQLRKFKRDFENILGNIDRLAPDYAKALKKIGKKETIVPYINPNKRMKKKEIENFHKQMLTGRRNAIENIKRMIKEVQPILDFLAKLKE